LERTRDDTGDPPRMTGGLALFIIAATALLALPRFAHTTPDSVYYTDLVAFFQGLLPRDALQTPFAFRWAVPLAASRIPGVGPEVAMALCSVAATIAAYLVSVQLWAGLLARQSQLAVAALLLVVSFPTVNYASAALTDAAGFLVLAAACHALVHNRFVSLGLILALGTGVRESTLLMVPALWIFLWIQPRPRWVLTAAVLSLSTIVAALATRWYFADLPPYYWTPTWARFAANMARPISWATVLLTLAPLLLALAVCPGRCPPMSARLRALVLALLIPGLLLLASSLATAHMSGRFCWPLYLALAPLAAWRLPPRRRWPINWLRTR